MSCCLSLHFKNEGEGFSSLKNWSDLREFSDVFNSQNWIYTPFYLWLTFGLSKSSFPEPLAFSAPWILNEFQLSVLQFHIWAIKNPWKVPYGVLQTSISSCWYNLSLFLFVNVGKYASSQADPLCFKILLILFIGTETFETDLWRLCTVQNTCSLTLCANKHPVWV